MCKLSTKMSLARNDEPICNVLRLKSPHCLRTCKTSNSWWPRARWIQRTLYCFFCLISFWIKENLKSTDRTETCHNVLQQANGEARRGISANLRFKPVEFPWSWYPDQPESTIYLGGELQDCAKWNCIVKWTPRVVLGTDHDCERKSVSFKGKLWFLHCW